MYGINSLKSKVCSFRIGEQNRCKKLALQLNNHQLQMHHHPRGCSRGGSKLYIVPQMSARQLFAAVACIWASIQLYQSSLQYQKCSYDVHHTSFIANAFSIDGWPSRRSLASKRSIQPRENIIYPSYIQPIDVPCRRQLIIGTRDYPAFRSSSLVCHSTVSNEQTIVETATSEVVESSLNGITINGVTNNVHINGVNEAAANNDINGHSNTIVNGQHSDKTNGDDTSNHQNNDTSASTTTNIPDIPTPTANGGFTHTTSSRAKISAANKGKVPWNKGKARSEETKARIAAGVRKRNRERFLAKLAEEGITEEEYNERKKAKRRKKDEERRKRRTAKGGYTPTKETKQKISKILTEKYANGEIKRRARDPSKVRRGFKHTEETKAKIRESLKRKWAEDTEYRELMTNKTVASGQVGESIRKRISETLKKRWEDPEFRANMMEKFANRKLQSGKRGDEHRRKISAAMKRKWMDEEYRSRATAGMAKGQKATKPRIKAVQPVKASITAYVKGIQTLPVKGIQLLQPMQPVAPVAMKGKVKKKVTKKKGVKKKSSTTTKSGSNVQAVKPITSSSSKRKSSNKASSSEKQQELKEDGSISRLREERRDLYDLLYGDEDDDNKDSKPINGVSGPSGGNKPVVAGSNSMSSFMKMEDDDDLDDFDPYGLGRG